MPVTVADVFCQHFDVRTDRGNWPRMCPLNADKKERQMKYFEGNGRTCGTCRTWIRLFPFSCLHYFFVGKEMFSQWVVAVLEFRCGFLRVSDAGRFIACSISFKHRLMMAGPLPRDLRVVSKETVTSCASPAQCWVHRRWNLETAYFDGSFS